MKTDRWTGMLGLFVVGLMGGLAPAEVVSFQQGADNALVTGYQGTDDNAVHSGNRVDQNAGAYHLGPVGMSPWPGGGPSRGLLRFDLSAMAGRYLDINSITLKLCTNKYYKTGVSIYAIKPANADWVEGSVQWEEETGASCWNYKAYDTSDWAGSEGLGTPDTDYDSVALATFDTPSDGVGGVVSIPLTAHAGLTPKDLIDQWSGNQADNPGLLLKADDETSGSAMFASSEVLFGVAPELIIDYEPAGDLMVGDANFDGAVDDDDLSLLLANWGSTTAGWGQGEFSGTPPINDDDLSLLLANWTPGGAVPEPLTLVLLAAGAVALTRRTRRG